MSFGDIVQSLKKAVFEGSVESASFSFTANVTAKKKKEKKKDSAFSLLRLRADLLNASPKEM